MNVYRSFLNSIIVLLATVPCVAQKPAFSPRGELITISDLPPIIGASIMKTGGRMISADKALLTLTGNITDSAGTRAAEIAFRASGYVAFRDGQNRAITFNGSKIQTKGPTATEDDNRVAESLLAHFPDTIFLQIAAGGNLRRIGGHFLSSIPNTYLTLFAFAPKRPGVAVGNVFQQPVFVAIDERTLFVSEVRKVINVNSNQQNVTLTQFKNWIQQDGQWFPSQIVRLENGAEVLRFDVLQMSVGAAAAGTVLEP